jgi:hypothetical protein
MEEASSTHLGKAAQYAVLSRPYELETALDLGRGASQRKYPKQPHAK